MIITKGLIAKFAAGIVGLGTTATLGIVYKDQINAAFSSTEPTAEAPAAAVNPDDKLLEFLKTDNQDIVFKVLKEDGNDLSDADFSSLTKGEDGTIKTITAKIEIKDSSKNFKVSTGGNETSKITLIQELKKLKGGSDIGGDWDWECKIKLTTDESNITTANSLHDNEKNKLLKESTNLTEAGFFSILKKNSLDTSITEATNKKKIKNTKINFIKKCAGLSTSGRTITNGKLSVEKEFKLMKGSSESGQETTKLYFKNEEQTEFDQWLKVSEQGDSLVQ